MYVPTYLPTYIPPGKVIIQPAIAEVYHKGIQTDAPAEEDKLHIAGTISGATDGASSTSSTIEGALSPRAR